MICLWKVIANQDEVKFFKQPWAVTLSSDKPCFDCDGKRTTCLTYSPVEESDNPEKERISDGKEVLHSKKVPQQKD